MEFLLASNNQHKLSELSRILSPLNIRVVTPKQKGIDLGEVEENGKTFLENAKIKAEHAFKLAKMPVVADDTGLMVDALNGAPGVYTARYAGDGKDESNIKKLLSQMEGIPAEKRSAKFVTSIYCILDAETVIEVQGECLGKIAKEPEGENGFGYDPIFISDVYKKTFAMSTAEEKDSISHRGQALRKLAKKLEIIINKGEI